MLISFCMWVSLEALHGEQQAALSPCLPLHWQGQLCIILLHPEQRGMEQSQDMQNPGEEALAFGS